MKNMTTQWVIKLQTDQVKGPYSTDAVIKMITTGVFSGNEDISAYPEGHWQALTKQPEFYEALLESLENPVDVDIKKAQKMEAETVIRVSDQHSEPPASNELPDEIKKLLEDERAIQRGGQKKSTDRQNQFAIAKHRQNQATTAMMQERDHNLTLNLSDIKSVQKKEVRKFIPFLFLVLILGALAFYFSVNNEPPQAKGWTLVAPHKSATTLTEAEIKNAKRRIVRAFQSGQVDLILVEHRLLAKAVEGAPKDLEAMGLLCMAYQQIWPFTKQTVQDLKSISVVTQLTRSINPISNYSDSCQIVYLMAKGQGPEAKSLLDRTLDHPVDEKFSLGPFLYLLKAEFLENEHNFINSFAYYEQASRLWPQWLMARFGQARMTFKQNNYNEARSYFQGMFDLDKESKAALFGLALVEQKGFKNQEKAYNLFSTGFKIKQTLPKDFHIEALLTFAQLLIDRGESKKALEVAQLGYQINPSHRGLKEIVLSLGGDDHVDNIQSEIILLGDHFARSGDHLAAQAQYKAAFDLDSKNATAAYKAAKSLWALNQTREAIVWTDKALKADPQMVSAAILKADYESQKYNFIDAAKTLQEVSRRAPQNHEILKGQALLEFRKNNISGAIQYGERAVKIYDADVELLSLLAQSHILFYLNSPGTKKDLLDKKNASLEAAQVFAGKAIDLEPSWPEAQITYAKFLAAKDGPVRGEHYLKDLIKNFPYTIEYRVALGDYNRQNEKFTDAAEVYLQAVEMEPKNKKANFGLAESYRILNKPLLAQKYYNATSILDPSDMEPLFANAKLLYETASGKDTQAKIKQALAKLKVVKDVNPYFPRVSFFLAKCYLELGDYQQAMEFVQDEKNNNPNLADPFLLAAEIHSRAQQYKECAAEYSKAIKLRPTGAELYVKAAACYRLSDAIDIAEDMLSIAQEKESGFPDIYREQGYIFDKKGFKTQAIQALEKYLELSPNAQDRSSVESKIKSLGG